MKTTRIHYDYWCSKKIKVGWFTPNPKFTRKISIDDLIPMSKEDKNLDYNTHNTLSVLRSARRRGKLKMMLERMTEQPGTAIRPKRRAAYCKKWLQRIEETT